MKAKGFTLLELMVVVMIVGVLATVSVINYSASKGKVAEREAISNLKLLQSAEKGYKLEMTPYYYPNSGSVSDILAINGNLSVALSNNANRNWNYTVYSTGCVQARRNGGDQRYFNLTISNDTDPASTNLCP